jgi:hypothetical protein
MTIKRNGEKVILKGGKVSCSCCDEEECCMYPAQALADGFYSASDLPDAVTISGVSYSRSGLGYGNTTNGVILEENVWARYTNGSRSSRACLIQGGVEDQFADTYLATAVFSGSGAIQDSFGLDFSTDGTYNIEITRTSLCEWLGTSIGAIINSIDGSPWSGDLRVIIRFRGEDDPIPLPGDPPLVPPAFNYTFELTVRQTDSPPLSPTVDASFAKGESQNQSSPLGAYPEYLGGDFDANEVAFSIS